MSTPINAPWLLLIPFCAILFFNVWALWNFSNELRRGKRRRVRRTPYYPPTRIYTPPARVVRFRRRHDSEAA